MSNKPKLALVGKKEKPDTSVQDEFFLKLMSSMEELSHSMEGKEANAMISTLCNGMLMMGGLLMRVSSKSEVDFHGLNSYQNTKLSITIASEDIEK